MSDSLEFSTSSSLRRLLSPRYGPLALITVFRPYVALPLLLVLAIVRWPGRALWRWLALVLTLGGAGRTLRRQLSQRQVTPGAFQFKVMTWNWLFANPRIDQALRFLATADADVIAIQELTPEHISRIQADTLLADRFPHQILMPYGINGGMGLFSRYPILEQSDSSMLPTIWARLDLGDGRRFVVVSGHPTFYPPRLHDDKPMPRPMWQRRIARLIDLRFLLFDPDYRDDGIQQVATLVKRLLSQRDPVLVVGDFNVTEREQGYRVLSAGLVDTFAVAGVGRGLTWRPEAIDHYPLALLRIDYMLASPDLRPLRVSVDHTPRGSDHSPITGTFEILTN